MKKKIHPNYHNNVKIICACGNVIETGSVIEEMKVEICAACHPFYTGKKKSLDATGRVDRFKKLAEKAATKKVAAKKAPRVAKNKK
ncbi:MAG: 50S ribosomal protein L31 [Candidatus Moranbacteria bacterium]|nr:50S ribosomal protein L31 [Candidatus Moranbacteria bacterium]